MLITLIIGSLALILGLAMVLGAAIRRRLLTGLMMTALPFFYPVYAWLNWSNASVRNGFLSSLAGALIVIAAVYGGVIRELPLSGANAIAGKLPSALPPEVPLPNAAAAKAIHPLSGAAFDPLADERYLTPAQPLPPLNDRQVTPSGQVKPYAYYALPFHQAARQVGKTLKLVTRAGRVEVGILTGGDARSLSLEMRRHGGSVTFEYRFEDLDAIFVYDREPPQAPDGAPAFVPSVNVDDLMWRHDRRASKLSPASGLPGNLPAESPPR